MKFPCRYWIVFSFLCTAGCVVAKSGRQKDVFHFAAHPRLHRTFPDAFSPGAPAPGSKAAEKKWAGLIRAAEKLVAHPIQIPEEGGQWIFYYACPKDNCSLIYKNGQHVCPHCGKVYDSKRVRLAYVTILHNRVNHAALKLAKAWYVTRRDDFAHETYRILLRYAELEPGWKRHDRWGRKGIFAVIGGKRYCQSLSDAVGIIPLARAYDLVYDWPGVTQEMRKKVEKDLFADTVHSLYALYFAYDGKNNHMTWYNAAVAVVGAVLGRDDFLNRSINGSKGLRSQFRRSVTSEGLWYEGTLSYHYYALQAVAINVEAARSCGLNLAGEAALKKLYLAPLQLAYPNGQLPAFNDGDRCFLRGYRRMYAFAQELWPENAVIREFAKTGKVKALPSAVYPDAGLAYLRRGKGAKAVTAVLDFGEHGGYHGHPDKLNMVLYAMNRELFLDPGRLTYRCPEYKTWARQTVAHNTVVINQRSQAPVAGTLLTFAQGEKADWVAGESAKTYSGVTQRRCLILFDQALVDIFCVKAKRSVTMDWPLHGVSKLKLELPQAGNAHPLPLGKQSGYQFLRNLRTYNLSSPFLVNWRVPGKLVLRTWCLPKEPVTVFSGTGIGYQLTQKTPFILLRKRGRQAIFMAIHDFSGAPESVVRNAQWQRDGSVISLTFTLAGEKNEIIWDAFASGKKIQLRSLLVKRKKTRP